MEGNSVIKNELNTFNLNSVSQKNVSNLNHHIERKEQELFPRQLMNYISRGRRWIGRPTRISLFSRGMERIEMSKP
jgi:hypothetical protein